MIIVYSLGQVGSVLTFSIYIISRRLHKRASGIIRA